MELYRELLDTEIPKQVKLSPNGRQVLYATTIIFGHKKAEHPVSTLWLAETGKAKSSRQLTSGLYDDKLPQWSPDGKSIAFISDRGKRGESSAIYMLAVQAGGEPYPLTPAENKRSISNFGYSPDGKSIAYLCADEKTPEQKRKEEEKDDADVWGEDWPYSRLKLIHVATKKVTTLVSNNAHVFELAWNGDGTKIAFLDCKTSNIESRWIYGTKISLIDVTSKEIKNIYSVPGGIMNLTWLRDHLHFIGAVSPNQSLSAQTVYSIDLKADTASLHQSDYGKENCAMVLRKAGEEIIVGLQHGMEDLIQVLNGRSLYSSTKQTGGSNGGWDAASKDTDNEIILAFSQSDVDHPEEVYTTSPSSKTPIQLSNHGHAFTDRTFGSAHILTCRSSDNEVSLDALYLSPSSSASDSSKKPTKPLPTVVLIHGGPTSRITEAFHGSNFMWPPLLLSQGYGILLPNYRGGTGKGEDFVAYSRGGMGKYDYPDCITLTQHAIEQGFADKERLVVGGWSQGGFLSYLSAVRNGLHGHGWKFKAAIPGAGCSDWDTMALTSDLGAAFQAELAGAAPWDSSKDNTMGRIGSPIWEFKAAVEKGDVIPPMLILHGEKDERVPIEQAVAFRRALEANGLPFEFVVYPREPHLFAERRHVVDMGERIVGFVDRYIGGNEVDGTGIDPLA